ncbi:MAG TPA: HD domain-containing protein [Candidatus Omnitrophota bacterium]|nr:HD domain-containing protein [Candidatus Omnitrophota bacterium]HQL40672.1 HD domain-containing protein [Candidatus Omnitrophota bacterium]
MRAGVIDIGSDTIRLLIGEEVGQSIHILESLQNPLPIGRSTFLKGRISQDMINQTISTLEKYKEVLRQYEVQKIKAVATTAVREAGNRNIFLDTIKRKTDFDIDVLNVGDVVFYIDSFLSFSLEKAYPVHEKNLLIAELGGGSLDISVMRKGFTLMNSGLSIGTMRLQQLLNKLDGSREENAEALKECIENEFIYLSKSIPRIQLDDIVLINENYFYVQNILPEKKITSDFFQLTKSDTQNILKAITGKSPETISEHYKIPLNISETLEAYATILQQFFTLINKNYIYVLQTSLSEAILASLLSGLEVSKKYDKTNQLVAVATNLCHRYNLDLSHAKHVAQISQFLFDKLKDHLGLKEEESLYLILAAYLHDIGIFVNNRAHHKHSEYIISSLNLFRLTDEEVRTIACIARYHRKATPTKTHYLYGLLPFENQILIQKLSSLLRMANALDSTHRQKAKSVDVDVESPSDLALIVHTRENFLVERMDFLEKKELFEEITGSKIRLVVKD